MDNAGAAWYNSRHYRGILYIAAAYKAPHRDCEKREEGKAQHQIDKRTRYRLSL
jgi:hypothetical protein